MFDTFNHDTFNHVLIAWPLYYRTSITVGIVSVRELSVTVTHGPVAVMERWLCNIAIAWAKLALIRRWLPYSLTTTCRFDYTSIYLLFWCTFFQFDALRSYLESGGCVLVMMTEGGEMKLNTNINFLLEELGVMANSGEPAYKSLVFTCTLQF